jgi:plastocyanin
MESRNRISRAGVQHVRRMRMAAAALAFLCVPLAISSTSDAAGAATVVVNNGLQPEVVTVQVGSTVTWQLADAGKHRLRSLSGPVAFDSGGLAAGSTYSFTFTALGTVNYGDDENKGVPGYSGSVDVVANMPTTTTTTPSPSGAPGQPPAPSTVNVRLANRAFTPSSISVAVGDTVIWTNADQEAHTVTDRGLAFDSGSFGPGATFRRTFTAAGTFTYICDIHPSMVGVVAVSAPSPTGTLPPAPPAPLPPATTPAAADAGAGAAVPTAPDSVSIVDFGFAPATLTVDAGATVTWTNTGAARHTVVANDGSFHSAGVHTGQTFTSTFAAPGTFVYICDIHPGMTGTILVQGANGAPPPPAKARVVQAVATGDVQLVDFSFAPASLTVTTGATVGFVNNGIAPHTATARDGSWDTGVVQPGATARVTFTKPGTFTFVCSIHPQMKGTLLVTGADGAAPPPEAPPAAPAAVPTKVDVKVLATSFEPSTVKVAQGGTVTWTIASRSPHRISADDNSFESTLITTGTTFSFRFDKSGTYTYRDGFTNDMAGVITVLADPNTVAGSAADGGSASVNIVDLDFSPKQVQVTKGATVTWTNSGQAPHTVTAQDKGWTSDMMRNGDTFSHTFGSVGTFTYLCTFHANMVGTVVVTDSSGAAPPAQLPQVASALVGSGHDGNGSPPLALLLFGGAAVAFGAFLIGRRTAGMVAHG